MLTLELPYPPSINHYFRNFRGRTVISAAGRAFRTAVCRQLHDARVQPMSGRLAVCVDIFPPDHRRRDVDNVQKALLDALQHGGAFFDDSQIVWLLTQKAEVVPGGKTLVEIRPVGVATPGSPGAPGRTGCALCGRYWN